MKPRILITLILALLTTPLFGSHFQGMGVWYESTGTNQVTVHNTFYYECTGVPVLAVYYAQWQGVGTGCNLPTPVGGSSTVSLTEVTPVCPTAVTSCVNNSTFDVYGIIESHTSQTYDISNLNCAEYDIVASHCCRGSGSTNMVSPSSQDGVAFARVTLAGMQAGNNGPVWDQIPIFYHFDLSQAFTFDQSATDPDGDSLSYHIATPIGTSGPMVWQPGHSTSAPFGPNWNVNLDSELGLLTIEPIGSVSNLTAILAIEVREWRNGVLLGTYLRDMQIDAANAPWATPNPPTVTGITNPTGGALIIGDTVLVHPGTAFTFDVTTNDIDPGAISLLRAYFTGYANYTFSDPGMTMFDNIVGVNPTGRFSMVAAIPFQNYPFVAGVQADDCAEGGMLTAEYSIIIGDTGDVWPGDANDDLVADVNDLLAIGLSFGNTGPARSNASNAWTPQFAFPWLDTIQGGVDFKHQDCNGSGIVNADDTLAIVLNYGLTHNKTGGVNGGPGDPPLTFQMPTDSAMVGDTLHVPILLGDNGNMVSNAYGIAFTINYDQTLIDTNSFYVTFDNNWMGSAPNALDLSIDMYNNSRCDAAFVRTDHQSANGMGQIGTAHFIIIDNIDGKRNITSIDTLELSFSNVNLIGLDGEVMAVNAMPGEMIITDESVDRVSPGFELAIDLYPNPAHDLVTLEAGGYQIESIEVLGLNGQQVFAEITSTDKVRIPLQSIPAGLYFVKVKTEVGTHVKKLLVE